MTTTITMNITKDQEANVWIVLSDEVPGFGLESSSLDDLVKKVKNALPEFLALSKTFTFPIRVQFQSKWFEIFAGCGSSLMATYDHKIRFYFRQYCLTFLQYGIGAHDILNVIFPKKIEDFYQYR